MKLFDTSDFKKKLKPLIFENNDNDFTLKLKEVESEVYDVFNEVCQDKEIPLATLSKLKNSLLKNKNILDTILSDMEIYDANIYSKMTKMMQLKLLLYLVGAILLFVYSPASYFLLMIYFLLTIKGHDLKSKLLTEDDYEFVSSKKQNLSNTISTSLNFISKKEDNLTRIENSAMNVELLANHVLDVYLRSGEVIEMSKEVETELIRKLQSELNVDIEDVLLLLNLEAEKMNEKSLDVIKRERKDK